MCVQACGYSEASCNDTRLKNEMSCAHRRGMDALSIPRRHSRRYRYARSSQWPAFRKDQSSCVYFFGTYELFYHRCAAATLSNFERTGEDDMGRPRQLFYIKFHKSAAAYNYRQAQRAMLLKPARLFKPPESLGVLCKTLFDACLNLAKCARSFQRAHVVRC